MTETQYSGPVRMLVLDVDGVLTDGTLYVGSDGEVFKSFNVRDGLAVSLLRAHGIATGVLSGKSSGALDERIRQLGVPYSITGRLEKREAIHELAAKADVTLEQIAYVGDDVVDLPLCGLVGEFYAPADAHPLVIENADHVVSSNGGAGVAREVAEAVLISGGLDLQSAYAPLLGEWSTYGAQQ